MMHQPQRRLKLGNLRTISNLCPHCLSRLQPNQEGEIVCTGDRLEHWKNIGLEFKSYSLEEKKNYLKTLDNPSKFLDIINLETGEVSCDYNSRMVSVSDDGVQLIPDPMVVGRIEKELGRNLTSEEMEEGYQFTINYKLYTIPFIKFPEDV